jgi:hypothetical protein
VDLYRSGSFPQLHNAVHCHFDADKVPELIGPHFVRGEVIPA